MSEQDPSSPSADSGQPEPASPPPGSAGYESGAPDSWAAPPPAEPRATGTGLRGADPGWPTAGSAPGKQVSVAVERVGEVEGQRYVAVRAADGKLYRIGEDRLRWVWRLVFTSVGIGHSMGASATPVTLVIAEKAWALQVGTDREPRPLRVACARCGRADSAWLFRTLQRATDDVYFTRCRRCWRSQRLGSFRRHPQA